MAKGAFACALGLLPACMPVLRAAGAPPIPEHWAALDSMRPDDSVLVIPLWSSQSGVAAGRDGKGPRTSPGSPFLIQGAELRALPARLGTRLNSYVVGPGWAAGSKTELRALYLISTDAQVVVMVAADLGTQGAAWIAVVSAPMSETWKRELVEALGHELVPFRSAGPDSLWGPHYTLSPPAGAPDFVVRVYDRPHKLESFDMPFAFSPEDESVIRQFVQAMPRDRVAPGSATWRQVYRR